jgi:hypothetical protein
MKFATPFFILVSVVISGVRANVPTIEADIAALATQAKALNNAVNSFPVKGGTFAQAVVRFPCLLSMRILTPNVRDRLSARSRGRWKNCLIKP